jgi:hypothetical protein
MTMRPEVELLLCCARPKLAKHQVDKIHRLLKQPVEWDFVVELINRHALHPLAYLNFRTYGADRAPGYLLDWLRVFCEQVAIGNLMRTGQLVGLLEQFQTADINVIPYKGPVLTQLLYGDPALRLYGDLDLLVPAGQVRQAKQLLQDAGYIQSWPKQKLTLAQEQLHLKTKYNFQFRRAADELAIELHWAVTPNYLHCPPNHAWLWERLLPYTLAGHPVTSFPPEEMLMVLCLHGSNHCWIKLSWVVDIAQLIRRYPALDWLHVLNLARRWHSQRMLWLALHLVHTLLDVELPEGVQRIIQADQEVEKLAEAICSRLFSREYCCFSAFEEPILHLRMRERWLDRLRYGWAMLTPTAKDIECLPLPQRLEFLYYLIRPARLLYEHGAKPWRRGASSWLKK